MSMTPETRAKRLTDIIRGRQESWDWFTDLIASAITQAENEALERASVAMNEAARPKHWGATPEEVTAANLQAAFFAEAIRSLKSQETGT
jgi:predicted deacetylase